MKQQSLWFLALAALLYLGACALMPYTSARAIGGKTIHARQSPEALSAAESWKACVADGLCAERGK